MYQTRTVMSPTRSAVPAPDPLSSTLAPSLASMAASLDAQAVTSGLFTPGFISSLTGATLGTGFTPYTGLTPFLNGTTSQGYFPDMNNVNPPLTSSSAHVKPYNAGAQPMLTPGFSFLNDFGTPENDASFAANPSDAKIEDPKKPPTNDDSKTVPIVKRELEIDDQTPLSVQTKRQSLNSDSRDSDSSSISPTIPSATTTTNTTADEKYSTSPTSNNSILSSKFNDAEKKERILERNRIAASNCRKRRKQELSKLQSDAKFYQMEIQGLNIHISSLNTHIDKLKRLLMSHMNDCDKLKTNEEAIQILQFDINACSGQMGIIPQIENNSLNFNSESLPSIPIPMQIPVQAYPATVPFARQN